MYNQTLHRDRKHFCRYCLQSFRAAQILNRHVSDYFKINGKQMIKMTKKVEAVKFKNYTSKIKSLFQIYGDLEIILILVPENNGKQNTDESYMNKYQNHVGCSFGYNIVYAKYHFHKPFKSYLGQDAIQKFIINMAEEN